MDNITALSLIETISALKAKKFSTKELNESYLSRIKKLEPILNSFIFVNEKSNKIPLAVKDLIAVQGMPMTCGSKILESYIPPYNATVIDNILKNNVSVIGKTNLDEFAMGSSGENSAFGPARNPWDPKKVPGGSSSGSAVAIAADLAVFALGTDTGGSIRQPAALCGIVGLKPSYGRVSRYGAQAMASSLDQIGPVTKTVSDARLVLEWISGGDNYDSNAISEKFTNVRAAKIKGLRIGIPKEYFAEGLNPEVEKNVRAAILKLENLGAKTVEINLPNTKYAIAVYYLIMSSEASSNLARYDGIRFGKTRELFGPETKRRIMLGTFALSAGYYEDYFIKAAKVRTLIKQDFEKAFEKCDVIAGPVFPTVAWPIGEKISDPLAMYLMDAYTIPASLAGIPALSLPCGQVGGLPVGLQLVGKYMDEATILDVAEIYEDSTNWHKKKPKL